MSLVQPCPSHVICSKITDLERTAFCADVLTDFTGEPAGAQAAGGGSGGAGTRSQGAAKGGKR